MGLHDLYLGCEQAPAALIGVHALAWAYARKHLTDGVVDEAFLISRGVTVDQLHQAVELGLLCQTPEGLCAAAFPKRDTRAAVIKRRDRWRGEKRDRKTSTAAGQLDVDQATLRPVEHSPESGSGTGSSVHGNGFPVPESSGTGTLQASSTRVGAHTRLASPEIKETLVNPHPGGGGSGTGTIPGPTDNDVDAGVLVEVLAILRRSPRLHVDALAIATVMQRFPGRDHVAAATDVLVWSTGPNVREDHPNAAGILAKVLERQAVRLPVGVDLTPGCPEEPTGLDLWLAVRGDLRERVSPESFDMWIAQLHVHELRDQLLVVGARHNVPRLRERFHKVLDAAAATAGLTAVDVVLCAEERRLEVAS